MSAKVDKFAKDAIFTAGLSETMAKRYMGTFGSMSEAFGFSEKKAYEMSETLTKLTGDVASFYNLTQDTAYTKLKSVFTGETEALKELGVVMTQSALDQYALSNGFGKTTKEMSEQEKVSLRLAFVQSQLANASGDFDRTQYSWANQTRIAMLQGEAAMAQFGQGLINVFRPVLIWGNAALAKIVQIATVFNKATSIIFGSSGDLTGGLKQSENAAGGLASKLGSAAQNGTALSDAANKSSSGLDKAKKKADKLIRTLAGFDKITKLNGKDTGTTGAVTQLPSGAVDVGGLDDFSVAAEKGVEATEKLTGRMAELKAWVDKLNFEPLSESWVRLKDAGGRLADMISGGLNWSVENVLAPLAKWAVEEAAPRSLDVVSGAVQVFCDALDILKPLGIWLFDHLLTPLAKMTAKHLTDGLDGLNKALSWTHELLKDLPERVTVALSAKVAQTKEWVKSKWNGLTGAWKDKTSNLKLKAETAASAIKSKWESITSFWKNKTATLSLKFSAAASDLKAWVNSNIIDKINAKFSSVPILNKAKIPHLAQGGYVRANTPQLVMIGDNRHQGEIVSPEDKLREMAVQAARMAGGNDETSALLKAILAELRCGCFVRLDPESMRRYFISETNRRTIITGKSELMV